MSLDLLLIDFPKAVTNSFKTYVFFESAIDTIDISTRNEVLLNLKNTKQVSVNMLCMFFYLLSEYNKKDLSILLPNKKVYKLMDGGIQAIFNYYAIDKRSFFKPRIISNSNFPYQ